MLSSDQVAARIAVRVAELRVAAAEAAVRYGKERMKSPQQIIKEAFDLVRRRREDRGGGDGEIA